MKVYAENSILQGNSAVGRMVVVMVVVCICIELCWYATVTLTSTTFASNSAGDGGGMYIYGDSSEVISATVQFHLQHSIRSGGHAICTCLTNNSRHQYVLQRSKR